jgi:hypothetical protein
MLKIERDMTDKNILKAVKAGYHKEYKFNLGEGFYLESHTTKSVFGNYDEWYFQVSYDDKHYGKEIKVGHFFYDHRRDGVMSVEKCAEKLSDMVADFYTKITSKEDFTALDLKRLIGGRENFHYGEWDFFRLIFVNGKFWGSIGGEDMSPIEKESEGAYAANNVYVRQVGNSDIKEYAWYKYKGKDSDDEFDYIINQISKDWNIKKWRLV